MRREATKPAREGPEFSTATTLSISNLPRRVNPSRFTRSYSEAFVRRRLFGKEKEPVGAMSFSMPLPIGSATFRSGVSVQQKSSPGGDRRKTSQRERTAPDFTDWAVTGPEIPLLRREIQWLQPDWLLRSLRPAEWWALELLPVRWSRSFARTPRVVRHWPECRCIFS